jgi:hypothetical protein
VKSGYDGKERPTRIFSRQTQLYLRRAAWRFLGNLARYRAEAYPWAAAEVVIPYNADDAAVLPSCYLLHRVLHGSVPGEYDRFRLQFYPRSTKKLPAGAREEAFPALWDAQPRAYLRVLGGARLPEVLEFAVRAVTQRHPEVLKNASHAEVLAILQAPHEAAVQLALTELERRFNPEYPDWELLRLLTADERPKARELATKLLRLSAPAWTRDPERIVDFLTTPHAEMRDMVVALVRKALAGQPILREGLARRLLVLFRTLEPVAGAHEGAAHLVREMLLEEISGIITVAELADLIQSGSPAVQSIAGDLLRRRPEAVRELGLERLIDLAQHEIAAVREAVHALLRVAQVQLRANPALLFVLVESEWTDTRGLAFDLLRRVIDPEKVNIDTLLGLLDSNRREVQDLGMELTTRHFARLDAEDLTYRLAQHPHPNMRRFALELVVKYLPDGSSPLGQLRNFFRAALFDLWPSRAEKRGVLDFLAERGLRDEQQAEVAAGILGDVARLQGRADFERALAALVRIKLAFPEVEVTVNVRPGGEA